jgi:CubicO group peptidase (beta-lactamase class C family)
VLAAVAERVSCEPFDTYVQRHIWDGTSMTRTTLGVLDDADDDRADGYG